MHLKIHIGSKRFVKHTKAPVYSTGNIENKSYASLLLYWSGKQHWSLPKTAESTLVGLETDLYNP